jgi:glycosyltransferase involved in cell wall biosynthesis
MRPSRFVPLVPTKLHRCKIGEIDITIRVVEPDTSGHHLFYVRLLAEAHPHGIEWVTTRSALSSKQSMTHLGNLISSGAIRPLTLQPWPNQLRILKDVGGPGDIVALPHGDSWLPYLPLIQLDPRARGRRYRVLLMRPPATGLGKPGVLVRRLGKFAAIRIAHALQEISFPEVRIYSLVDPFGFTADSVPKGTTSIQDPILQRHIPTRSDAREKLGIVDDEVVIGLLGAIGPRKNPGVIAAACAETFATNPGKLLVVGTLAPGVKEEIEAAGLRKDQLILRDGYVSDDDLVDAARASDIIALLYDNAQSPSGILALACQVGSLVLVPQQTQLADIARLVGIGLPCRVDAISVTAAIAKAVERGFMLDPHARDARARLSDQDFVSKMTADSP